MLVILFLEHKMQKTIDERKHYMIEASKELNDVINASRLDLKTSSEHLAKLTTFSNFKKFKSN